MADSMLQKNRTFPVAAIGHKPSAICSGLTPYAIGSSFSGRGGRLAELSFQKKTQTPLFYLQSIYKGRAFRFSRSLVARQLPVSPLSYA
jgi:hypothetical protein